MFVLGRCQSLFTAMRCRNTNQAVLTRSLEHARPLLKSHHSTNHASRFDEISLSLQLLPRTPDPHSDGGFRLSARIHVRAAVSVSPLFYFCKSPLRLDDTHPVAGLDRQRVCVFASVETEIRCAANSRQRCDQPCYQSGRSIRKMGDALRATDWPLLQSCDQPNLGDRLVYSQPVVGTRETPFF